MNDTQGEVRLALHELFDDHQDPEDDNQDSSNVDGMEQNQMTRSPRTPPVHIEQESDYGLRYLFYPRSRPRPRPRSPSQDSDDEIILEELMGNPMGHHDDEDGIEPSLIQLLVASAQPERARRAIMPRPRQDPLRDVISVSTPQMFRALMTMIYNHEEDLDFSTFSDYSDIADTPVQDNVVETLERFCVVGSSSMGCTCTICRDQMRAEQTCIRLPCSHVFHEDCICTWFTMKNTCPLCRIAITNNIEASAQTEMVTDAESPASPARNGTVEPIPSMLDMYRRRQSSQLLLLQDAQDDDDEPDELDEDDAHGQYQLILEMSDYSSSDEEDIEETNTEEEQE